MKGAQPYGRNPGTEAVRTARSGLDRCLVERRFQWLEFPVVRRVAAGFGVFLGFGAARLADFVLAVSETAACAVCHGAATAVLQLWHDGTSVCCEVRGEAAPGMRLLTAQGDGAAAMRLSLLRQVCDYVHVEADSSGVTVRVAMTLTAPPLPG
jgi:anti-sigma regulatory factor (Ser/Thr protein kinase)